MAFESEKMARDIAEKRNEAKILAERKTTSANTLESFMANAGEHQTVNVIIKSDVQGSAEAVKNDLLKLKHEKKKGVSKGQKFDAGESRVFLTEVEIIPYRETDCGIDKVIIECTVGKNSNLCIL